MLSPASQQRLIDLARLSLRQSLGLPVADAPLDPPFDPPLDPPGEILQPAGCFISLHEAGTHRLRGCIGRIDFDVALAGNVTAAARDVLCDPRFVADPVKASEWSALELEISVLSAPRDAVSPLDFDLLNDGIYLHLKGRSGFFLPQVARQTGWTKEQLLDRLCAEKLGLLPNAWRDPKARMQAFAVTIIGPELCDR